MPVLQFASLLPSIDLIVSCDKTEHSSSNLSVSMPTECYTISTIIQDGNDLKRIIDYSIDSYTNFKVPCKSSCLDL